MTRSRASTITGVRSKKVPPVKSGASLHHIVPFARGGRETVENLALRCRCHNGLAAEEDFGERAKVWRRGGEPGVRLKVGTDEVRLAAPKVCVPIAHRRTKRRLRCRLAVALQRRVRHPFTSARGGRGEV